MKQTVLYSLLALTFVMGACTYTMKIQDGAMAYERKQYAVAVNMLKKEYNKADTRLEKGRLAYLIGQSYNALHQSTDAINWYKIAYDNQYGVDALRDYAFALKANEQYKEAQIAFKDLGIEIGSPYEYRKEIRACEIAMEWAEEERPEYRVEILNFNSASSEYAPVLFGEDQLIITSDRDAATGDDTYNWTGQSFADLFVVDLSSNQVTSFDPIINSDANEGTISFSPTGNEVFFTRCDAPKEFDAYCKLMISEINEDGSWNTPKVAPFTKEGVNYMHPTVSEDGSTLFFSADDPEGWGGFDIYKSERQADGNWGEPKLLSRSINTSKDEQFPFIDQDTLYFSSDGHTGMGGLDIFKSYRLPSRNWAPPLNLKPPLNSGGDDFGLVIDRRQKNPDPNILATGYFSTRRIDGMGNDDIYRFEKIVPPPAPEPEGPVVYRNLLDVYVLEKIYADPTDPNSKVLGRRPLPGTELTISLGDEERSVTIDEEGKIRLELQDDALYNFFASKENYLVNEASFDASGLGKDPRRPEQLYELEIVLDKIFLDKEITLENIYYDFNEWYIRDDAQPTLNELSTILQRNPDIRIQLGSHTDCRGQDRYNETLSQRRAQSAVDYLIAQGIDASRLEAVGYGENEPAVDCICSRCSEDEHQANRRTTFKILQ